jgi:hypothetical protein
MTNHTGRELQLMLDKKKPLSMFYDDADVTKDETVIPEEEFDSLVELGILTKGDRIFEGAYDPRIQRPRRTRYVLYALKGEEWRIEAMFLVLHTRSLMSGYDEGLDRITGLLLGYTDDEVNRYVASRTTS